MMRTSESGHSARLLSFPCRRSPTIFRSMAKAPDSPNAPQKPKRDPAKHSKKDPARPTRAKANRPDFTPTAPELEALLNPGIQKGTAGLGSGAAAPPPARH